MLTVTYESAEAGSTTTITGTAATTETFTTGLSINTFDFAGLSASPTTSTFSEAIQTGVEILMEDSSNNWDAITKAILYKLTGSASDVSIDKIKLFADKIAHIKSAFGDALQTLSDVKRSEMQVQVHLLENNKCTLDNHIEDAEDEGDTTAVEALKLKLKEMDVKYTNAISSVMKFAEINHFNAKSNHFFDKCSLAATTTVNSLKSSDPSPSSSSVAGVCGAEVTEVVEKVAHVTTLHAIGAIATNGTYLTKWTADTLVWGKTKEGDAFYHVIPSWVAEGDSRKELTKSVASDLKCEYTMHRFGSNKTETPTIVSSKPTFKHTLGSKVLEYIMATDHLEISVDSIDRLAKKLALRKEARDTKVAKVPEAAE